ncbi:oxygen-dependent coproporphyrinogen oxidase [Candidatus Deianiraea vastatrix]|uniref:coproporphyrinogen oxidase n=1 Tax=Candidatus Deianiraea vastatrix TaxID=2163644 RepID=A0A5B8XF46_9RICK|nr:oxygen-dependent coproporphyrinogen oxidase [Candidatus Deianiraea vastatrix]QED23912.1 Coproporphyrinogen-III oxidase, aerobic [Candidatus Deianiraea vastatrix]
MPFEEIKKEASSWFYELRYQIISMIEKIELEFAKNYSDYTGSEKFEIKPWERNGGGGGEIGLLRGRIMEKMGVNVSTVFGDLAEQLAKELPGTENGRNFWASGVSLVAHPRNPFVPPIHMNTRCIQTAGKIWFGGGIDLNPIFEDEQETKYFHAKLKEVCDKHNSGYYEKFSKWCDEYFWIKHRNEARGIGGIFFDYHLENDSPEKTFPFVRDVGALFVEIYDHIVRKKVAKSWTKDDVEKQLFKRGRYAEFNLIYDRGIKFGLMTGGNADGMMMSLPPICKWD